MLHNALLQRCQDGFRLCQGSPDLLDALTRFLQADHVRDGVFVTIVVVVSL